MELVDGEPLNAVISRMGRLPVSNTLDMLEQTGRRRCRRPMSRA